MFERLVNSYRSKTNTSSNVTFVGLRDLLIHIGLKQKAMNKLRIESLRDLLIHIGLKPKLKINDCSPV